MGWTRGDFSEPLLIPVPAQMSEIHSRQGKLSLPTLPGEFSKTVSLESQAD
jgi:hypothetical protein